MVLHWASLNLDPEPVPYTVWATGGKMARDGSFSSIIPACWVWFLSEGETLGYLCSQGVWTWEPDWRWNYEEASRDLGEEEWQAEVVRRRYACLHQSKGKAFSAQTVVSRDLLFLVTAGHGLPYRFLILSAFKGDIDFYYKLISNQLKRARAVPHTIIHHVEHG